MKINEMKLGQEITINMSALTKQYTLYNVQTLPTTNIN